MIKVYDIPVYCINLSTSKERWENMLRRCKKEGLDVKRWEADTPETLFEGIYYEFLNPREKACASSHLRLWEHFITTEYEAMFILEDDAVFFEGWKTKVSEFLNAVEDWDAIFLNVSELVGAVHEWVTVRDQCLTGGYILSRQGAHFLLSYFKNKYYASDWMTQILQTRGKSYSYFPWLIIQDNSHSYIRGDKSFEFEKVTRLLKQHDIDISKYNF